MSLTNPFAETKSSIAIIPNVDLTTELNKIGKYADLAKVSVILLDMTGKPKRSGGFSMFSGRDAGTTRYSASLVKIAAMYAAFRLRKNFREAANETTVTKPDEMIGQVMDAWKPIVEKAPGSDKDFPNLKRIFAISGSKGSWIIDFDQAYFKRMQGMIGPSDNHDASYCILSLGYKYIQGALAAEGLYSGGGLWLSGDYAQGRDGDPEPVSKSHQAASATSVATFLTLLMSQGLVKDSASATMRGLMTNCYMTRILDAQKPPRPYAPYSFGKLGRGPDGTFHDCAVIERPIANGTIIRYCAVILGSQGIGPLWRIGTFLDDVVEAAHT